jgi:hypothetical protein
MLGGLSDSVGEDNGIAGVKETLNSFASAMPAANAVPDTFPVGGIALFVGSPPSGWTRFAELDGRFPRGASTYGATGGATEHSHSFDGTTGGHIRDGSSGEFGLDAMGGALQHHHSFSGITAAASNLPPYLDIVFAQKGPDAPDAFPVGGIALFVGSPPSGWTRFAELDGRFPRGASTYGATGGATEHSHSFDGTTGGHIRDGSSGEFGLGAMGGALQHHHSFSGITAAASNLPPYLDIVFAQKGPDAPDAFPVGGIALFAGSLPPDWTRFAELDGRFPRGASTYGATGGATEHSHSFDGTTGGHIRDGSSGEFGLTAMGGALQHHHSFSGITAAAGNLPPYLDIVFAQKGNQPPNQPTNPSPADHATEVLTNAGLTWIGGDPNAGDSVTYDVYFDIADATTLVTSDQSSTTYSPPGVLNCSTTYYWKVVAEDNHGATTPGPVWDFTTQDRTGVCGDVAPYPDCDGIINMGDVVLLLNYVGHPGEYQLCCEWCGDVAPCPASDDIINMGDVVLLLNYVGHPGGYELCCE